ncbi:hypothetical protein DPMN_113130 [Dreissena polymorpha]|uniref:Uncharacterized protein n=1 Tax=Dreissena polymorpha TaxID=45954 RepID=A0A9D4KI74_DREPO|nr:hypothetical protein DPMN_113130 [Dreissena polymorpha]
MIWANFLTKFHEDRTRSTKVPEGRTDGQRQNNIPPPMAGDNKIKINDRHIIFKLKKSVPQFGLSERTEQKCHYLCKSHTALLSSDNHLVDGPTDRPTYRQTDRPT